MWQCAQQINLWCRCGVNSNLALTMDMMQTKSPAFCCRAYCILLSKIDNTTLKRQILHLA